MTEEVLLAALRDGARFADASFGGSVRMSGNVLRYADLRAAELNGCDLSRDDLEWAVLDGAQLAGANLRDATLNRASPRGADLSGADLRNANLGGLDLRTVKAQGATIFERQARQLVEAMGLLVLDDN